MEKDTTLCLGCDFETPDEREVAWQYSKNFQYKKRKSENKAKKLKGRKLAGHS